MDSARADRIARDIAAFAAALRNGLDALDFAGRQRLVRLLVERVAITGDNVTIEMDSFPTATSTVVGKEPCLLPVAQPKPGGMTLQKPGLPWRHDPAKLTSPPSLVGGMVLQIGWRHGPAKTSLQVAA